MKTKPEKVAIPYHALPTDPQDCLAFHRLGTVLADDIKQALVVETRSVHVEMA